MSWCPRLYQLRTVFNDYLTCCCQLFAVALTTRSSKRESNLERFLASTVRFFIFGLWLQSQLTFSLWPPRFFDSPVQDSAAVDHLPQIYHHQRLTLLKGHRTSGQLHNFNPPVVGI